MKMILFVLFFFLTINGCKPSEPAPVPVPVPVATPTPTPTPAPVAVSSVLSWEKNHPERAAWSKALKSEIEARFADFDSAKDAASFCPKYASLSHDQKVNMWQEMIVQTAIYECSWDPKEYSVDVGNKDDKDTWSVGLLQMSVVDQANYHMPLGYNFSDLQDPIKNLHLAIPIMANLIKKYGVVMGKPGVGSYWGTIRMNTKGPAIQDHTKALAFCK